MTVRIAEINRSVTGRCPDRTGDGNMKSNPRTTPRRMAAVRLANLKKLLPITRGEMKSRQSNMPTPSWENKKKKVDEIIVQKICNRSLSRRERVARSAG